MVDPLAANQPKHYKGQKWFSTTASADRGGVHVNSGVCNHLYYLLCTGQNAIDKTKTIKLFYDCLTKELGQYSDYKDLNDALKKLAPKEMTQKLDACLKETNICNATGQVTAPDYPGPKNTPAPLPIPNPQPMPNPQPVPWPNPQPAPWPNPSPFPQRPNQFPQRPYPFPNPFPQRPGQSIPWPRPGQGIPQFPQFPYPRRR